MGKYVIHLGVGWVMLCLVIGISVSREKPPVVSKPVVSQPSSVSNSKIPAGVDTGSNSAKTTVFVKGTSDDMTRTKVEVKN